MEKNTGTLLFGGTGFIGGHVARKIRDRGERVVVYKRRATKPIGLEGIDFVEGDLSDPAQVRHASKGARRIVFCAGYYPNVSRDVAKQIEFAVAQLKSFFEAIPRDSDLVYVSSFTTIGHTTDGTPSNEDTFYDESKLPGAYYRIKRA